MTAKSKNTTEKTNPDTGGMVENLKTEGKRALEQAKDSAEQVVEEKKSVTADYLRALAAAADTGAAELDRQGYSTTASFVSNVADDFDGIVEDIAARPVGTLVDDVADFARERPVLFFGAAFLVGLGTARFAKSTAQRESRNTAGDPNQPRVPGKGANV